MSNSPQKPERRKRTTDVFVIVLCVLGALFTLNLFRLDLLQSITSQNRKPVGTVTAKNNNVQRRLLDRVLWSRLTVESPVYSGDLIRVAEHSSATLNINGDVIDLPENTMIRIRASSGWAIVPAETPIMSAVETAMPPQANKAQDADKLPKKPARSEPEPIAAVTPQSVTHSAPESPQSQTPALLPEEENFPPEVPVHSGGFISPAAGWKALSDSISMSNISIIRERIHGAEKEVMIINATLASGHSKWAGATLTEENYFAKVLVPQGNSKWAGTAKTDINLIHKLINANGVRFKVLGDGERWRVYFATTDVTDTGYHGVTIATKKGEISSFDISFNELDQPKWSRLPVSFIKNNIKGITIEKNDTATDSPGTSAIKVFDFEIY